MLTQSNNKETKMKVILEGVLKFSFLQFLVYKSLKSNSNLTFIFAIKKEKLTLLL